MKPSYLLMFCCVVFLYAVSFVEAQTQDKFLPPSTIITPDNVHQLQEIGVLGLGDIYNIAISPNGKQAVVASSIGLTVYSVDDWTQPAQIIRFDAETFNVAFTASNLSIVTFPSSSWYWSPPGPGDLALYDLVSGDVTVLIQDFSNNTDQIAVDSAGRWIATVEQECRNLFDTQLCGNGTFSVQDVRIHIWDMSTGSLLHTIKPNGYIYDLEFQPNSSTLIYMQRPLGEPKSSLVFWDVIHATESDRWTFDNEKYNQFTVSGHGDIIGLPVNEEGHRYLQVEFLNIEQHSIQSSVQITYQALEAVGWHYNSDILYDFSGRIWLNDDGSQIFSQEYTDPGIAFYIWDVESGQNILPSYEPNVPIQNIVFSPVDDSSLLFRYDDTLIEWWSKLREGTVLITGQRYLENAIVSADNRLLAIQGQYGHALYEMQTGRRLYLPEQSQPLAFSNDSELIALKIDDEIQIWDLEQNIIVTTVTPSHGSPLVAEFSPDITLLAVGLETPITYDDDGNIEELSWKPVRIYDLETGELLAVEQSYAGRNRHLSFSSEGDWLMTDVGVWNIDTLLSTTIVDQSERPDWIIGSLLAMSDDGKLLATVTSSKDKGNPLRIIHLYDLQKQIEIHTLVLPHGNINALAFNPSGTLLASASQDSDIDTRDNSVRIWSVETGQELITLETQPNDFMRDVEFSSDGRFLITLRGGCHCEGWGFDSLIRIWGIPIKK